MKLTKAQIESANVLYANLKEWGVYREAIKRTFDMDARNYSITAVLPKIAVIEGLYGTRVNNPCNLAKHIIGIKELDKMLLKGDHEAIELLRQVNEEDGRITNMLVFATKFGHFSNKNAYPIYDSFVSLALENLTEWKDFDDSQSALRTFAHFYEGIDQLKKDNHLQDISYEDLDIYLWPFGQLLTLEANARIRRENAKIKEEDNNKGKKKEKPVNKEVSGLYRAHPELFEKLR